MSNDQALIYSGKWLRTQSDEELQAIVDGNYPGSAAYDGALAELQRRRSEAEGRRQLRWIKLTFFTGLLLGVAGIVATLLS